MFKPNNNFYVLFIALIILTTFSAIAEIITWTGAADNDWHNAANWSGGSVPGLDDDVVIPEGTRTCNTNTTGSSNVEIFINNIVNNGKIYTCSTNFCAKSFINCGKIETAGGFSVIYYGDDEFTFRNEDSIVTAPGAESNSRISIGAVKGSFTNNGVIELGKITIEVDYVDASSGSSKMVSREFITAADSVKLGNNDTIKGIDIDSIGVPGGKLTIISRSISIEGSILGGDGGFNANGGDVNIFAKRFFPEGVNIKLNSGKISGGQGGDGGGDGGNVNITCDGNITLENSTIRGGGGGSGDGGGNGGRVDINCSGIISLLFGGKIYAGWTGDPFRRSYIDEDEGEGGDIFIFADSIYMAHDSSRIDSYDTTSINARKMYYTDLGGQRICGDHLVEFNTPEDGIIDFLNCFEYATVVSYDEILFTCDSLLAPHDSFHIFYMYATVVYDSSDTSIVGASFGGDYYIHSFNDVTDTFSTLMQNQSMTTKVLDYSISSCRGWVSPFSGSSASLAPFKMDSLDIEYTVPTGLIEETTDTVMMILTISGTTFADTTYAYITSDSGMVIVDVEESVPEIPQNFALSAYPNPFNSAVTIAIDAPSVETQNLASLQIEIFDVNGRRIETLRPSVTSGTEPSALEKGGMEVPLLKGDLGGFFTWQPAPTLGSGVYLVRVRFDNRSLNGAEASDCGTITKRIVYLK